MSLHFRFATPADVDLFFRWANDETVRKYSYQQNPIVYQEHIKWFNEKVNAVNTLFYVFLNNAEEPVGQVRIEHKNKEHIIGISIDAEHRGKSYGAEMLKVACSDYLKKNPGVHIYAYVKIENGASLNIFKKAGFILDGELLVNNEKSIKFMKS